MTRAAIRRPGDFFESLGRAVADLGFSGVIEKFEEHWGKRATRWLLLVIGLGVAAVCIGAIWEWLVSPILLFLQSPDRARTLWSLVLAVLGVGGGIGLGFSAVATFAQWRRMRLLGQKLAEAKEVLRETQNVRQDIQATRQAMKRAQQQTRQAFISAQRLSEAAFNALPENERKLMIGVLEEGNKKMAEIEENMSSIADEIPSKGGG